MLNQSKVCTRCLIEKDIELFNKNKTFKDGYTYNCKECTKLYYKENKEKILSQKKKYNIENKEKIKIKNKKYYIENREYIKKAISEYYAKNKERLVEIAKQTKKIYYKKNKDIISEKIKKHRKENIDRYSARAKRYYNKVKNTEDYLRKRRISDQKRRALKLNTKIRVTNKELEELIKSKTRCYWCFKKLSKDYHIDHYVPLSKGGSHTIDNLVISCPSCNLTKSAKDPIVFANENGRLL